MPLGCFGNHDYSLPVYERVKLDRPSRFPLYRVRKIEKCMACGEVRELVPEPVSSRIRTIPFRLDAQNPQEAP